MARILLSILLAGVVGLALSCNPGQATGPQGFSVVEVYGIWKIRTEGTGCAPSRDLELDFTPFSVPIVGDSVIVGGRWWVDEENPTPRPLTGAIHRSSGLAHFSLDDFDTQLIAGVFVSNRDFAGAYTDVGSCTERLRGKFLE